jgi:hypothetical protein
MALRSKTKEQAATTKVEIMSKFERLRAKGIRKSDLK